MTHGITRKERIARITALVAALDDAANYRIPAEVLRAARLVPGWSLKRGTPGLFEVDCPGRPGLHLNRDDTLALLRSRWLPAARAELGAPEVDAADAPAPPAPVTSFHVAVDVEGLLTRCDPIVDLRDDGVVLDDRAARTKLLALFTQGVRRIPIGEPCEGFSSVTGCPGHRVAP